ncbi:acetoin utilization protein AcuC [Rhodospirillaceae bacterium]|nr:acetoin utilization protein AcuC [Rhodospirillaceae bacterium]MBT7731715.1 acetoin utilization protein AcuC [Rhodospirillaceae bacterium]MDC1441999.1 acetoin utilization protein AcuC [Rhodospirillaceae bacterium]
MKNSVFPARPVMIGSEIYRNSRYGEGHPLSIERVTPVMDLTFLLGWADSQVFVDSPCATPEMISRYHDEDYVAAVQHAEKYQSVPEYFRDRYNLGTHGNPIFPEVYTRPATAAGASILAGKMLSEQTEGIIYSIGGGTHHAQKAKASGFCFFNDIVLGILEMLDNGIERVLYVDLDAHHGDGVQDAFVDDDRVFTISIHEEGRWPRTGDLTDRSSGAARNLPVPKGFNDSELNEIILKAILPLGLRFRPEAIVIQMGCDGLADDPQSKLELSNLALWKALKHLTQLASRVLVVGGGGYNPWATARAWSGVWATLNNIDPVINLPLEATDVLKSLTWKHSRGRNPPQHWYYSIADKPNCGIVRDAILTIIEEVLK